MSRSHPEALEQLAQWRRAGFGIWHITFVIDGYDDSEIIILPGRMKQKQAIKQALRECADHLGTEQKWIHLKSIVKEKR